MKTNYQKLGFKCGLELHQQLEGKKLFCNCLAINSDKQPDIKVERKLRAVAGELGMIDEAALHEMQKGKTFLYQSNSEDTCLIEYDEEPPMPINKELVKTALQIAVMLDAKIVDEIQVMRKTVVDGSNTTGFQRTALIARDGFIKTSKGRVNIPIICLEEEAAQKIKETKEHTIYSLDRLGIGLIEIGTAPDIKDPEHAKETAEKLGLILRSTGKCKRGIGTIRQDVNVSIKGHPRIEIKGFQELKSIPKILEYEVKRQLKELKNNPEPHVRKAEKNLTTIFLRPMPGSARMYPETDVLPVKPDLSGIKKIETINEKIEKYEKQGLNIELAKQLAKSPYSDMFENFTKKFKNIKPAFIASTLISTLKEIKRKFNADVEKLTDKEFEEIFNYLNKGKISKDIVMDVIIDYSNNKFDIDKYASAPKADLEKEIKAIIGKKPGLSIGAYMGLIMAKYKGKVDGKKAMEILKNLS